jgi:hypothetical protein
VNFVITVRLFCAYSVFILQGVGSIDGDLDNGLGWVGTGWKVYKLAKEFKSVRETEKKHYADHYEETNWATTMLTK